MQHPDLPTELHREILKILWLEGNQKSLAACALVSKEFRAMSQSFMFSNITLWDRPTAAIPGIANRLPSILRGFRIEGFRRASHTFLNPRAHDILQVNMKVLRFVALDFGSSCPHARHDNIAFWADLPEQITTGLATLLRTPTLRTLRLAGDIPAQLLQCARTVRELELASSDCSAQVAEYGIRGLPNSILPTKIHLDSLIISQPAGFLSVGLILSPTYYTVFSFENLRRLSFHWLPNEARQDLLAHCTEALEDLVVTYGYHAHRRSILGPGSGFFDASRHRNLRVVSFNGLPPLIDMSILREIVGFFEESFKRLPDRVEKVRIAVRLVVDWEDEEVRNETLGLFRRAGEILLSRRQSAIVPTLHLFLSNSTPDVWVHGLTTHLAFMETIGKLKIRRFNPGPGLRLGKIGMRGAMNKNGTTSEDWWSDKHWATDFPSDGSHLPRWVRPEKRRHRIRENPFY